MSDFLVYYKAYELHSMGWSSGAMPAHNKGSEESAMREVTKEVRTRPMIEDVVCVRVDKIRAK